VKQGDVVLVRYPYTNLVDYKIRPAVIVSNETFNKAHSSFLACPITSKPTLPEYCLELTPENFHGKLETRSFVRTDSMAAVEKELCLKEIGFVEPAFLKALVEKIAKNF